MGEELDLLWVRAPSNRFEVSGRQLSSPSLRPLVQQVRSLGSEEARGLRKRRTGGTCGFWRALVATGLSLSCVPLSSRGRCPGRVRPSPRRVLAGSVLVVQVTGRSPGTEGGPAARGGRAGRSSVDGSSGSLSACGQEGNETCVGVRYKMSAT